MTYAVKVTGKFLDVEFVEYVGNRGERKRILSKIEGWKRKSTAERWIENQERMEVFGLERLCKKNYEIIAL